MALTTEEWQIVVDIVLKFREVKEAMDPVSLLVSDARERGDPSKSWNENMDWATFQSNFTDFPGLRTALSTVVAEFQALPLQP